MQMFQFSKKASGCYTNKGFIAVNHKFVCDQLWDIYFVPTLALAWLEAVGERGMLRFCASAKNRCHVQDHEQNKVNKTQFSPQMSIFTTYG